MSNLDIFSESPNPDKGSRKSPQPTRRGRSVLAIVLVVALVVGSIAIAVPKVLKHFSGPADFSGNGTSAVSIQITSGETLAQIGNMLKAKGVVASVDAFTQAAANNSDSSKIQPGFYNVKLGMSASSAITTLLDPTSRNVNRVTIPEGKRVSWIIDTLAAKTSLPKSDFVAALKDSTALGLPDYAKGNPEGFLFPATYDIAPDATAASILKQMVDKYNEVSTSLDLSTKAAAMGMTPQQIVTIASLLQVEGHPRDFTKVARVVYNRLAKPMRLEFDSTVNYGLSKTDIILTTAQLAQDTPYNTYLHDGLTPSPIDNPGADAIKAALNPATGDWLYFTTVNLDTQETKFATTYSDFLTIKNEFLSWCSSNPGKCS